MPLVPYVQRMIVVAALTMPVLAQPKAGSTTLPSVTSYSLDKTKVTLPDDLTGKLNVLILYFQPDQSQASVACETALRPIMSANPEMQTYILPVYARENWLYRWWVGTSLRSSAPPAQEWHSTVPIFVDKPKFLPALGIRNEKQFVILLTDRAGRVEWRTEGPLDPTKLSALVTAVKQSGIVAQRGGSTAPVPISAAPAVKAIQSGETSVPRPAFVR